MTGIALLREVMKLHPAARRVLLTAYADTDVAIAGINEIALDHYLMKPWDPPEQRLYPVLDDLLSEWRARVRPSFEGIRVLGSSGRLSRSRSEFLRGIACPTSGWTWNTTRRPERSSNLFRRPHAAAGGALRTGLHCRTDPLELARAGLQTQAQRPFYGGVIGGGPRDWRTRSTPPEAARRPRGGSRDGRAGRDQLVDRELSRLSRRGDRS
jgi:thioredoxin reductase (NADPH)